MTSISIGSFARGGQCKYLIRGNSVLLFWPWCHRRWWRASWCTVGWVLSSRVEWRLLAVFCLSRRAAVDSWLPIA